MLRNMKFGAKLVFIGSLLIVVPLVVVSMVALMRATGGLTALENEQLASRAAVIAEMIDRVFAEEQKLALSLSADPDIVAAARAVSAPLAEQTPAVKGGKAAAAGPTTADLVARADQKLKAVAATKGLGEAYEGLLVAASDGHIFTSSNAGGVGVNISDRDYFKTAMAGKANVGAAARSKVTNKPVTPIIAPIVAGNQVVGAVALIADISFLNDIIANQKIGKTGYAFVIDKTGLTIAHPRAENVFAVDVSKVPGMEEISRKMI
ncbi:MAG TPA: cache domain-containing protein, partial [Spirochaetia bacterium]|nr:cache domain-containing protein [Spirochaetia bacterium]